MYNFCNLFAILKLVQNKRVEDGCQFIDNFYPSPLPLFLSKIRMQCWRCSSHFVTTKMAEQKDSSLDSSWHRRASVLVLYCLRNLRKTLWLSVARHGNHNWHSKVSNLPRATQSQSGRTRINTQVYLSLPTKHVFLFYSMLKPRLLYEIGVRISNRIHA